MKRLKRIMALVIAMAMVLGMGAMTAFAADDFTLTINNTVSGHTYTAYQIFEGSKADHSQVQYVEATTYTEGTTYYYKNGADYDVIAVADAQAFGTISVTQKLYTRTGNSGLGNVIWGADITTDGKKALYAAYNMTVADADLDDPAKIQALVDAIADVDNTTTSESDKAVKFANVFFETSTGGDVTAKTGLLNTPAAAQVKTADGTTVNYTDLASGYYIINDSYSKQGEVNGIDYSIARIAVQVVGDTVINNKADKPTVEKKIKTAGELVNDKANELGIGRVVEFEVTEAVPNYDGYNYYYFNMFDKLSDGLTFDPASVTVKIGNDSLTQLTAPNHSTDGKGYYLYSGTADASVLDGNTFMIAFEDIMKFNVGQTITVTYSASVNSSAITGINPNTNEVKTEYSNSPDKSEKGDIDNDHPGVPANDENHPTGTTPSSYTDTYTTKLTIHKVDGDGNALQNVEFTLTGTSKDVVLKNETVYELDSTGTYYMLKDGTYTTTAPQTTPSLQVTTDNSGWVEMAADDTYTGTDIRIIDSKKYRPFVVETDKDKTRYIIIEPNDQYYASTTLRYKPVTVSTTDDSVDSYKVTMVGKTDASGNLDFSQLGAGTYTLSETGVLTGYNDIEDITFTITCTLPDAEDVIAGVETATWSVSSITPTGTVIEQVTTKDSNNNDVPTGEFKVTIENQSGTELPSTGGIGTTIFYVVGTILVIGAGVILITRKRMDA